MTIATSTENGAAIRPGRLPDRISQATAVEQSRAVAEVQAAIVVAQQCPRNPPAAGRAVREACGQMALAERAFFRYSRGDGQISGPSVQLARELARCWGNVQYGIAELRRDDEFGQSEMIAFAWDVQTNARASTTFIVPHRRDTKKGVKQLTDLRDVYENNANNGARRVREMIFAVLPVWLIEDAIETCNATLKNGGGRPLAQRLADALRLFGEMGVTDTQLEAKLGKPAQDWTEQDAAQLSVIYRSIKRGEARTEDEFPPAGNGRVSAADIIAPPGGAERAATAPAANGQASIYHGGPKATPAQVGAIQGKFRELEFTEDEREQRLTITAELADLPGLDSTIHLRKSEASAVIEKLEGVTSRDELITLLVAAGQDADAEHGDG